MYLDYQLKNNLLPFESAAATSATDKAIQKKIYGSGTRALIISNEEMKGTIKTVKSLKNQI